MESFMWLLEVRRVLSLGCGSSYVLVEGEKKG